jgi:peroxiredoxin
VLRLSSFVPVALIVSALSCASASTTPVAPSEPSNARVAESSLSSRASETLRVGQPAPWLAGWSANDSNEVINLQKILDELKRRDGRGVAVVFCATWCSHCRPGLAHLRAALPRLRAAGLDLVFVAYLEQDEPPDGVAPWLEAQGLGGHRLIIDKYGRISSAYGVEARSDDKIVVTLPRTVVLDQAGVVRAILEREGEDYVMRILSSVADG